MYNFTDYCLDGEVWKDIPHYEGIYQASSFGRIRTIDGKITYSTRHGKRHWKGRIIKPKLENDYKTGYRVTLWKDKRDIDYLVARLVAVTFFGYSPLTVNHINGNRLDNRIENLEWLSLGDNIRHGFDTGLYARSCTPIILIDKSGKIHSFRSLSQASLFLGKCSGYLSNKMIKEKRGKSNGRA